VDEPQQRRLRAAHGDRRQRCLHQRHPQHRRHLHARLHDARSVRVPLRDPSRHDWGRDRDRQRSDPATDPSADTTTHPSPDPASNACPDAATDVAPDDHASRHGASDRDASSDRTADVDPNRTTDVDRPTDCPAHGSTHRRAHRPPDGGTDRGARLDGRPDHDRCVTVGRRIRPAIGRPNGAAEDRRDRVNRDPSCPGLTGSNAQRAGRARRDTDPRSRGTDRRIRRARHCPARDADVVLV
jgi:hypothetical protein